MAVLVRNRNEPSNSVPDTTMAVSVLPLIALVLVTLHVGSAARIGSELAGKSSNPCPGGRACAHRVVLYAFLPLPQRL